LSPSKTQYRRSFGDRQNNPRQGTSGSRIGESFFDIISFSDVTEVAREFLKSVQNRDHVVNADKILAIVQSEIIKSQLQIKLPKISAFLGENGALLLEWIFNDFRIGFNFEVNENESGWYMASKPSTGGIVASGLLSGINLQGLIAWLVFFAISRSLP
jgi:hypothetical protein